MWFHLCVGLFIVRLCLFAFVARILCIGMIVTLFCHCLWVWWAVWVVRLQFEQLGVFIVVVGCFVGCSGLVVLMFVASWVILEGVLRLFGVVLLTLALPILFILSICGL